MKCDNCPVEAALECLGERYHPPACRDMADGLPGRAQQLVTIAGGSRVVGLAGFDPAIDPSDRRIRVGLLAPCIQLGGAETWQQQLARAVDPARVAWSGLVVPGSGAIDPAVAAAYDGIMPVGRGRAAATRLASASDVLVTWAVDGLPGILDGIPVDGRPKVISVVHAPIESEWGQYFYTRPVGIDRWVAVSELARDAVPEASRSGRPIDVIWNAVDPGHLTPRRSRAEIRASWGVSPITPVAGFLQRLTHEKDPLAAARLAEALPDPWRVVIVGDGPMMGDLRRLKAERHLDRLVIAGPDLDAGGALAAFDALVVPSEWESFCLTIGEGLWIGVPVIATAAGIAKLAPGLVRPIPIGANGPTLAAAVLADAADRAGTLTRVSLGMRFAQERLSPARFGREWTELICSSARPRPREADPARLAMLAELCPHGSGACGCGSVARDCSRPGNPPKVWRQARDGKPGCLDCVAES